MSLIRKVWAALVALFGVLFTRQGTPASLQSMAVEAAPAAPVEVAPAIDILESHSLIAGVSGSPLKALIDQMERVFPVPVIKPGVVLDDLQYKAGQRAVVEWVKMQQQRGRA